jgi:hypothetical protein
LDKLHLSHDGPLPLQLRLNIIAFECHPIPIHVSAESEHRMRDRLRAAGRYRREMRAQTCSDDPLLLSLAQEVMWMRRQLSASI